MNARMYHFQALLEDKALTPLGVIEPFHAKVVRQPGGTPRTYFRGSVKIQAPQSFQSCAYTTIAEPLQPDYRTRKSVSSFVGCRHVLSPPCTHPRLTDSYMVEDVMVARSQTFTPTQPNSVHIILALAAHFWQS